MASHQAFRHPPVPLSVPIFKLCPLFLGSTEFREEGYPIGSGTVESGIKQFKARLTGSGMRWSRPGAERMLIVRASVLGDSFDALWQAAA